MWKWVWEGMRRGIKTTAYPSRQDTSPGISPGFPADMPKTVADSEEIEALVACCPTEALVREDRQVFFREQRCIHCYRCLRRLTTPLEWQCQGNYEWAASSGFHAERENKFGKSFRRSLHLRVIDAGACGACLSEIEQLNKPYYNMHRLGFFLTPTPREADVLLVAGPVTDHMRVPLLKAYEAMPDPKGVLALGACAIFGGIFGTSFASLGGASSLIPVDILLPGCPPPPLAILHALLTMVGRAQPKMCLPADSPPGGQIHV
jgi:Ni,Fe-hydrogenase III small subunit